MKKFYHIPHSSNYIPQEYLSEYCISKENLDKFSRILCDHRTDEMIDKNDEYLIFPYSRLFCDVERFDSDLEVMNKIGMGILYNVNHNLDIIREYPSNEILKYYYEHHKKLNDLVGNILNEHNEILFIDLHSYAKDPLPYELNKNSKRPQICIGVNDIFDNSILSRVEFLLNKFEFEYHINEPFSGCLLPSNYIDDDRVKGIMIEIRKDVYETKEGFSRIKNFLKEI